MSREGERPIEERLSLLDRPTSDVEVDSLDEDRLWRIPSDLDMGTVRLAMRHELGQIYLMPDPRTDLDGILVYVFMDGGGGGAGFPRSVLRDRGAGVLMTMAADGQPIVLGPVPDDVVAVQVDDSDALLGENVFIAVVPPRVDAVVVTRSSGERLTRKL